MGQGSGASGPGGSLQVMVTASLLPIKQAVDEVSVFTADSVLCHPHWGTMAQGVQRRLPDPLS